MPRQWVHESYFKSRCRSIIVWDCNKKGSPWSTLVKHPWGHYSGIQTTRSILYRLSNQEWEAPGILWISRASRSKACNNAEFSFCFNHGIWRYDMWINVCSSCHVYDTPCITFSSNVTVISTVYWDYHFTPILFLNACTAWITTPHRTKWLRGRLAGGRTDPRWLWIWCELRTLV